MSLLAFFIQFAILKLRKKRARTSKRPLWHLFLCTKHSCNILKILFLKTLISGVASTGWVAKSVLVLIFLFKRQLWLLEILFLGNISDLLPCHSDEETKVQRGKECAWGRQARAASHIPRFRTAPPGAGPPVSMESLLSQRPRMMTHSL